MAGDQTSKVFRLAGSLEATAEEPRNRAESAEKENFIRNIFSISALPGEGTDDQTVEHEGRVLSLVEAGGVAGLDGELTDRAGELTELL